MYNASGFPRLHDMRARAIAWYKRDPMTTTIVAAASGGLIVFVITVFIVRQTCGRGFRYQNEHRHVQLKDTEESGMPPQIVGFKAGEPAGPDTFVIGDDDEEGFESARYVNDMEGQAAARGGSSSSTSWPAQDWQGGPVFGGSKRNMDGPLD